MARGKRGQLPGRLLLKRKNGFRQQESNRRLCGDVTVSTLLKPRRRLVDARADQLAHESRGQRPIR